ncbi:MAG TPA: UvrD-helicase domain-containing protein, partial [Amaricoccus sp.]|uniref:UvrD-helicase domain-containing protein n=1 Tax=Amaricoccus sp. TaxID=1872485 RepID=UPI002C8F06FC
MVIEDATRAQVRAADPAASSWVSANAGTGKTRVLTDRVARLLLSGCEPQKILCLTYTKAAAAEMQNRLFRTLGTWAMLPDAALAAALAELGETPAADLPRARTLFARALETPGGLRIQTIHAFCEALIRRFPLEAGVPPQFGVLEDRQARALREDILDALAKADPASFAALARQLPGDDPDPLLLGIAKHRDAFATPFDGPALARALGAQPGITPADLAARLLTPDVEALLRQLVPYLAASGK